MEELQEWQKALRHNLEDIAKYLRSHKKPSPLAPDISHPHLDPEVQRMEKNLHQVHQKLQRGMKTFADALGELASIEPATDHSDTIRSIGDMVAVASVAMREMTSSIRDMSSGKTLQDILGLSSTTMQSLYKIARYFYEQQQYEQSSSAFYLLSLLNPFYNTFWVGLANSEYFLKRYQEAILAYTFAGQTNGEDASIQVLIGRCHIGLGNFAAAKHSLNMAEELGGAHKNEQVQKQIVSLREDLLRYGS